MEDGLVVNEAGRNMGNRELVSVDKFTFFDVGRTDLGWRSLWLQVPSREEGKGRPHEKFAIFSFAGGKGKQVIQRPFTDLDYI
jgi:hypothetical protein